MAYILMGYDVENYLDFQPEKKTDWQITLNFLKQVQKVHKDLNAPCTLFICGRLLEEPVIVEALCNLKKSELFDLQQHTYSHQRLKTVVQNNGKTNAVFPGASLEKIQKEISLTNKLFKDKLDINCKGLCGPYGYYRGLMDRPDILRILFKEGIRFIRTYLRNEKDWGPLSINVQPFRYEAQGFPEMLEIPSQGWQDIMYFRANEWNREKFIQYEKSMIDKILQTNFVWSVCHHDWTSCQNDAKMAYTHALLKYAQSKGVIITTHKNYYKEIMKNIFD